MRRRPEQSGPARLLLGVSAVCAVALVESATGAQVFQARVDTVRVDAGVYQNGRPVVGLTSPEFEILDNGVRQEVELVSVEQLPVQVMLALDVSQSVQGQALRQLRNSGLQLVGGLRPGDSAGLIIFSSVVSILAKPTNDLNSVAEALSFQVPSDLGGTSLIDAAHAALLLSRTGHGRPMVILFSDGADTASFLPADAVVRAAQHSDAIMYAVATRDADGAETRVLADLSRVTGGETFTVGAAERVGETFAGILQDIRSRYLLSYSPKGVSQTGWHEIVVRTPGRRTAIKARPGYWAGG